MKYAEVEVKRITSLVINKSISYQLDSGVIVDDMFSIVRNGKDEIEMIDFNTVVVNKMLSSITSLIENNLELVANGEGEKVSINLDGVSDMDYDYIGEGIIFEASAGSFVGSSLISNIGPSVPVKLSIMGDVISNLETKVSEYGINNALVEVGIKVNVDTMVSTPFVSDIVSVEVVIPISVKVISGNIPSYYLNEIQGNSNLIGG